MSRCFPFPPPGYEKKPRLEDANALKEEKKEKKHKEKKDKEKREGKERRDKEKSNDKHREKKDRKEKHKKEKHKKEKHRDRKKDKEDKNKEKGSNSETSGIASVPETKNIDKHGTKEGKDQTFISFSSFSDCQNEEKTIPGNLLYRDTDNARFVQELSRRTNDEKVTSNQLEGFLAADNKIGEREKNPVKGPGNFAEDNGKDNHRHIDHTKDWKGIRGEVGFRENSTVQSFARTGKCNIGDLPPSKSIGELLLPSNNIGELARATGKMEKRMEGKEKPDGENDKPRNKHKDKDREKKSHKKDKDSDKKKKKVGKPTNKKEDKNTEPDKSININQSDFLVRKNGPDSMGNGRMSYPVGFAEVTGSVPFSDQRSLSIVEGNQKKRKEIDINGFVNDNEGRANKFLRPSPHQLLENGRKLEAHESPILFTSEKHGHMQGVAPNLNKEPSKNGFVLLSDQRSLPIVEGNQKKRKEVDINGFVNDNEGRANKLLRPSPHRSLENGRKLEAHKSPILFASEKHGHMQGVAPNLKMDNKERSKNGFVESKSVPSLGPNLAVLNDQSIEKSRKQPTAHPDMKFLSQILTVPKMDELSSHNDQEWLFSSTYSPKKKLDVSSAAVGEGFQVWSEALNIESVGIVALPYVLPY